VAAYYRSTLYSGFLTFSSHTKDGHDSVPSIERAGEPRETRGTPLMPNRPPVFRDEEIRPGRSAERSEPSKRANGATPGLGEAASDCFWTAEEAELPRDESRRSLRATRPRGCFHEDFRPGRSARTEKVALSAGRAGDSLEAENSAERPGG